ncbi:RING finger protein [Nosema granulosis]|uniref:RING finger protein n=1 Tax=Nosema granulosis TaxID=83296 RepID=A0A9P6GZC2_9MICR|nr:RING finger protein [Nosema granulosis]
MTDDPKDYNLTQYEHQTSAENAKDVSDLTQYNRSLGNDSEHPRIIREYYVIKESPSLISFIPIAFTFLIYGIIIQSVCVIVKKINKPIYESLIRLMLVIFPPLLLFIAHTFMFPVIWLVFATFMIYKYVKINRKPIGKDVPRETYDLFKKLFIATNIGIGTCQALLFLSFFFFVERVVIFFLLFVFFLYFGLLSREIILLFSETMAINTGFYSKEGVPGRSNNNSLCMICTKVFDNTETIHTLVCGHSFHECCIKGWCMIAKKGFCPYCKKGVDMNTIPSELWYKTEVWFYPMINMLKNFILFAMFMSIILIYKYYTNK